MPLGTRHHVRGLLLREGAWLIVAVDGGGRWRLDTVRRVGRWLGRRVEISGVRDGFDLLAVTSIRGEHDPPPRPRWWRRVCTKITDDTLPDDKVSRLTK